MIIFDEIINNGSGLYIIFEKGSDGKLIPMLTRLVIPSSSGALFSEWSQIFDGSITTYALDLKSAHESSLEYIALMSGNIANLMKPINWSNVSVVKYLDHAHTWLYQMIIEAGTTISVPEGPDPIYCACSSPNVVDGTCSVCGLPVDVE